MYDLCEISVKEASEFVRLHHYSKVMPRLMKLALGGFRDGELKAVITFGWGVRPLHTIRRLFPSLTAADYFEIGKMCLLDSEPRTSETQFIKQVLAEVRRRYPACKLIFTWADAIWGKPGYVYQAANFLYGGFIWTDVYRDEKGRRVHPRQLRGAWAEHGVQTQRRPNEQDLKTLGWTHIFGKQFRYIYFLCGHAERKRLLRESTVLWIRDYPKHCDLQWKVSAGKGSRVNCEQPMFEGAVQFRRPAPIQ